MPNPSFEQHVLCPDASATINYASGWNSYNGTPDYFNSCATNLNYKVPNNGWGYQNPDSGNAYAGFWGYYSIAPNARECIGRQLTSNMIIGKKYFIKVKFNLGEISNCGIDKIGIKFSTITYSQSNPCPVNNVSNVFTATIITDTANWITVSSSFVADSSYDYIIVGNFFDDNNTDTTKLGSPQSFGYGAYYYVDDICVSTDSLACSVTGIEESASENIVQISPNPFNEKITVSISNYYHAISFSVYNTIGEKMVTESVTDKRFIIQKNNLQNGIYFLKIYFKEGSITKKVIITN